MILFKCQTSLSLTSELGHNNYINKGQESVIALQDIDDEKLDGPSL